MGLSVGHCPYLDWTVQTVQTDCLKIHNGYDPIEHKSTSDQPKLYYPRVLDAMVCTSFIKEVKLVKRRCEVCGLPLAKDAEVHLGNLFCQFFLLFSKLASLKDWLHQMFFSLRIGRKVSC